MTLHDAIHYARMGKSLSLRCPAHDDRTPSLSVRPGRDGAVLIKCHRGCPTESVLAAVGLKWADICSPRQTLTTGRPFRPSTVKRAPEPLDDDERKAKRATWPKFEPPTDADLDQIAAVRGLGREGLEIAVAREILWVVRNYYGHRCWVVTDAARIVAQVRRLDGEKFQTSHGEEKSLSLPGSTHKWPLGIAALADEHRSLLLTEGGPDLLAAFQFIACEGRQQDAAAVAILGGGCEVHEDLLPKFKGRRVRIAQHADESGLAAMKRWARQLKPHVAQLDRIRLEGLQQHDGQAVKDLNDLARIHPDEFKRLPWICRLVP